MVPNRGFADMADDQIAREITLAKYKGFMAGLISAGAMVIGTLGLTSIVKDVQILSDWENVPQPNVQRGYDSDKPEIKSLDSEPRIYNLTEGKPLSQYIIEMEKRNREI